MPVATAKANTPSIKVLSNLDNPKLTEQTIKKGFARLGSSVVTYEASKLKRSAGIAYQEISLTFADSQQVVLRIKQSGDVYQALLNGKAVPLRSMDNDTLKTFAEIDALMDKGRTAFAEKMRKTKVNIPSPIKITRPKQEKLLIQKRDALKEAIAAVDEELAKVGNPNAA